MAKRGAAPFVSIGTKLALLIAALVSVFGVVLYRELVDREWDSLVRAKMTAASMVADLFERSLVVPLDFGDSTTLLKDVADLGQNPDVTYAGIWSVGAKAPLAELHPASVHPDLPGGDSATAVVGDAVVARRTVLDPIGKRLGVARIHFSLAPERTAFDASKRRIFALSVVLAAGVAALLIGVTRRLIVTPLERLAAATRKVEEGGTARVSVSSNDELGRLGEAFNRMAAAIVDRERRLQELFDHMRQAIVVFGPDGIVERSASRRAEELFETGALEGTAIRDVLYAGQPDHSVEVRAFEEWREVVFASPVSSFDELAELAPSELTLERPSRDPGRVVLLLEFRPIARDGVVNRVMLLASDVTEARDLKHLVEAERLEHARRISSMRLLLAGGAHQFQSFAERAAKRLGECLDLVRSPARSLDSSAREEIFKVVHTMRGEARTFELSSVEASAMTVEEILAELGHDAAPTEAQRAKLAAAIEGALAAVRSAIDDFVEASPIGRAILDQVTVLRSDVATLLAMTEGRGDEIAKAVAKFAARPFGELAVRQTTALPALAEKAGKEVRVDVQGKDVPIPAEVASVLSGVLTHLCRNAVAHGIEPPLEREEHGKPKAGRILLSCTPGPSSPLVAVEDDGAGLDTERIRAQAKALGVAGSEGGASELVFLPGLSTAGSASDLAGRGMGLAAVADDLARIDWKISVSSEPSKGTRFTLEHR